MVGEEKDILKEIRDRMETEDQEEVIVKAVKELEKSPAKSVKSSEWSLENGLLYYRGKIKELKKSPTKSVKSSNGCWKMVCYIIEARSMSPNPTFSKGF